VFVVDTMASITLLYHSFDFHRASIVGVVSVFPFRPVAVFATSRSPVGRLTYWHRRHTSNTRLPILFIHGIGVGLYPYIKFLTDINADDCQGSSDDQVGIIAIEIMSISSRITAEAMSKDEMCDEMCQIIQAHGWDKFVLVSHSYVFLLLRSSSMLLPTLY
jgi:pimeloyl-ACP methyl ester carboxylesterase